MPRKPKPKLTAAERQHNRTKAALELGIHLLEQMEAAGALRLPFIGYPEAMKVMRATVGK